MLRFLKSNFPSVIVALILAAIIVLIIRKMINDRKKGKNVCGCSCMNCAGSTECMLKNKGAFMDDFIKSISINEHSSIKIKNDKILYFDPFNIKEQSKDADIIFITHEHYDHFSVNDIKKVIKNDTTIIMPKTMSKKFEESGIKCYKALFLSYGDEIDIQGINIKALPSYNNTKKFHPKENGWLGYLISMNDKIVYVAGDTDKTTENEKIKCDIAMIPIGGTYTMDSAEAAELINKICPKYVIPTHYGSVVGNKKDGERFASMIKSPINVVLLIK